MIITEIEKGIGKGKGIGIIIGVRVRVKEDIVHHH
jgi:hypothetical protein